MNTHVFAPTKPTTMSAPPVRSNLLQRKCARSGAAGLRGESEESREKGESKNYYSSEIPPIVDEVLNSPGQPLDTETRAFMEPRFGYDFSRVRVHSGAAAEQSARHIDANAYTVRQNIVFGAGQFAPHQSAGRNLLAHELAHVVQQGRTGYSAASHGNCEQDAEDAAGSVGSGNAPVVRTSAVSGAVQRQPAKEPTAAKAAKKKSRMVRIERYWGSPSARAFFEDGSNEEVTFVQASRLDPASQPEGAFEKVVNLTIDRSSTIRPHVEFASHSSGSKVKIVTRLAPADRISKLPGKVRGEVSEAFLSDTANESIPETMEFAADIGEGLKETSSTTKIELEGRDPGTVATMQVVDKWVGEQQSTLDKLGTMRRARFTQLLSDVRRVKVTGSTQAEDLNAQDIELVLSGAAGGQSDFKTFDEFKRVMQSKLHYKMISIPEEYADNPDFYFKNEYRKAWKAEAAGLGEMSRKAEAYETLPFKVLGATAAVGTGGALLEAAGVGAALESGGEKVAEWFAAKGVSSGLLAKWVGSSLLASGVAGHFISARDEAKAAGIDPNSPLGFANTISTAVLRGFGIGQLGESITDRSIQTGQPLNRSAWDRIVAGIEGGVGTLALGTLVPEGPSVPTGRAPPTEPAPVTTEPAVGYAPHVETPPQVVAEPPVVKTPDPAIPKTPPTEPAPMTTEPAVGSSAPHVETPPVVKTPEPAIPKMPESSPVKDIAKRRPLSQSKAFGDLKKELKATGPEGTGPVKGQRLGQRDPTETQPAQTVPKKEYPAEPKGFEDKMARQRSAQALKNLDDAPDLQNTVKYSRTRNPDNSYTLRELAENSPSQLRRYWEDWQNGLAEGKIKTKNFSKYARRRQILERGRYGEATETFARGPDEIVVKAPKDSATLPGSDMVTYNVETGRIKYLDNKAYRSEASVGKVSAAEKNLVQNMADDIAEIEKYAAKKGVPPEIKNEVLPDMKAAQQELAEYIATNKPENLYDPQVQKAFDSILENHDIDRVVTTSGGGKNVTVTKGLQEKGFKQE